jgi:hypothetical protein
MVQQVQYQRQLRVLIQYLVQSHLLVAGLVVQVIQMMRQVLLVVLVVVPLVVLLVLDMLALAVKVMQAVAHLEL